MSLFGRQRVPLAQARRSPLTIAVWGPTGAPGRTTLAVGLAGAFAHRGERPKMLIVDCDMGRGKVACALGAPPGNTLVTACALPPPLDAPCAPGHLQRPRAGGPWLIAGLATPEQWPDVDPRQLARLLGDLRDDVELMVLDVGAALPPDPRGDGHRVALAAADVIVAVCRASPAGLEDFFIQFPRLLATLGPESGARVEIVLNHVAPEAAPRHGGEVARRVGITPLAGLPHDHAAVEHAEALRQPLPQASPRSPAAMAICRLAEQLYAAAVADQHAPAGRGHW